VQIQSRLLKLAGLFLSIYALALTLSPAARARTWDVDLRWSHWLGLIIWAIVVFLAHKQTAEHTPDADPYLFPATALLAGWGLLTIWRLDSGFGLRQALWLAFCTGVFIVGVRFPQNLDILRRYKYIFLVSGLLLTALTLIFGTNPGGSGPRLWLGCCGLYLQPSEPLKLLLVVYLAAFFADRMPIRTRLLPLILPSLFLTGLALAILLTQRDLGTASIFIFLYAAMVYMASGQRRLWLVSIGVLIIATLVGYFFVDIIRYRLTAWIDPWTDPSGRSYQVIQSILAVANGGLYGRGPGMGSPGLVPVAHSDFIFTSIAEETGLIGTIALIALLALIGARGFLIAIRAASHFRRLLAAGITTYFCAQAILIIGGNLRLLPLTGVTLPFISYGGSSLLTSFIGLLVLMQISNEVDEEPAGLTIRNPYMNMAALMGVGFLACTLANGWWADIRADDLLNRTDNPRRAIADRFVLRGAIFDRQNRAINITDGQPGSYSRRYLVPELSAITGYTHPTYGQAGLEASLDPYLRGLQGNPALLIWWDHVLYGQPPTGLNFRLSLDLDIQKRADEMLGKNTGALVLANAQTGEILAMASHPTFDANQLDSIGATLPDSANAPLLNRATQGSYSINSALTPLLNAAYGSATPSDVELKKFFNLLGFYKTPQLNLPAAEAAANGTLLDMTASPVQMISAAAALSNQGLCPGLQIASAVETPAAGWVVLPELDKQVQCLPADGAERVAESLQDTGKPFWEYVGSGSDKAQPITWFLAGTLPNWSGTPLAVVVVLEEKTPSLAQSIGRDVLQKAIQP
jgi:cell division protein FtsW (lipid II flippase)